MNGAFRRGDERLSNRAWSGGGKAHQGEEAQREEHEECNLVHIYPEKPQRGEEPAERSDGRFRGRGGEAEERAEEDGVGEERSAPGESRPAPRHLQTGGRTGERAGGHTRDAEREVEEVMPLGRTSTSDHTRTRARGLVSPS